MHVPWEDEVAPFTSVSTHSRCPQSAEDVQDLVQARLPLTGNVVQSSSCASPSALPTGSNPQQSELELQGASASAGHMLPSKVRHPPAVTRKTREKTVLSFMFVFSQKTRRMTMQ
jgi:hypothetical protein